MRLGRRFWFIFEQEIIFLSSTVRYFDSGEEHQKEKKMWPNS